MTQEEFLMLNTQTPDFIKKIVQKYGASDEEMKEEFDKWLEGYLKWLLELKQTTI